MEETLYRTSPPVVDINYDNDSDKTFPETLVLAIAKAEGVPATDLPLLYDIIDPESLAQLLDRHKGVDATEAVITFQFGTWDVFIRVDGRIRICDRSRFTKPKPVFEDTIN